MKKLGWFFLWVLIGFAILQAPIKAFNTPGLGWDHEIYCKAVDAAQMGLDPYVTENLGLKLSFTYPALFLKLYEPFCFGGPKSYLFYQVLFMVLIATLLVKKMGWDLFLVLGWTFIGFNAAYSNYSTGNIGIMEALFFTLFLVGFVQKKEGSTLWLVPSAFFKIIPSVLVLPPMLEKGLSWMARLKSVVIFGVGLLAASVLNYLYSPDLFLGFFKQIMGGYGNQHSPIREIESNASNPTVLLFLKNLSEKLLGGTWLPLFLILISVLVYFSYWVWKNTIRNEQDRLLQMCWSYLILFLWLPRLKPYSFLIICIVMIPLMQRMGRKTATWLLLLTIFHRSLNGDKDNPWVDFIANNTMIYVYVGIIAFLAARWSKVKGSAPFTS